MKCPKKLIMLALTLCVSLYAYAAEKPQIPQSTQSRISLEGMGSHFDEEQQEACADCIAKNDVAGVRAFFVPGRIESIDINRPCAKQDEAGAEMRAHFLLLAVAGNSLESARFLVEEVGLKLNQGYESEGRFMPLGTMAFLLARARERHEIARFLWHKLPQAAELQTSFIRKSDVISVRYLVENMGCDLKLRNTLGKNILQSAAFYGSLPVVRYLVENVGMDITECLAGDTSSPLLCAVSNNHALVAQYLLQKGADAEKVESETVINNARRENIQTAFGMACWRSKIACRTRAEVDTLIAAGQIDLDKPQFGLLKILMQTEPEVVHGAAGGASEEVAAPAPTTTHDVTDAGAEPTAE